MVEIPTFDDFKSVVIKSSSNKKKMVISLKYKESIHLVRPLDESESWHLVKKLSLVKPTDPFTYSSEDVMEEWPLKNINVFQWKDGKKHESKEIELFIRVVSDHRLSIHVRSTTKSINKIPLVCWTVDFYRFKNAFLDEYENYCNR